jgi:hypothetical protein
MLKTEELDDEWKFPVQRFFVFSRSIKSNAMSLELQAVRIFYQFRLVSGH